MPRNNMILIPIPLLVLAVFPMPYSFYGVLRAIVFMAACTMSEQHYRKMKDWNGLALAYACAALLFNPIVPAGLSRASWFIFDIGAAALFYYSWTQSGKTGASPTTIENPVRSDDPPADA
ncbi:hypothetical protein NOI24_16290 [Neorhizobium galegae]|uniref:DUF6804 family protein n=1 Tax=Neorhizobium galegae TaxID=399 RepID=UPI002106905C|nr:DUF6804 family protein [Neorhizobium galegae]MCQ1772870.1 hypothetical protein [Neorhizobium galegae]MCQ1799183.1 hypothetical protein [Neorhizobium galegae]